MKRTTWVLFFAGMLLAGFPFLVVTGWGHGIPWILAIACLVFGLAGVYAAYAISRQAQRPRRPRGPRTFR